ncbi:MAG TPA: DegT/DnrJ/EryC1/StrS family aminotransferase [Bryobacteraceae bacterium]|nr:DegT/DnrJ/EryC1/StrS family aminotransferase [Bryobacteraceae bacterium]
MNLQPALRATAKDWRANLSRVISRGHFILGEESLAFEQEFARSCGARYCIGVSSGTAAIELALREAEIDGEVLTSALTAPFTAVAIRAAGCTPQFCDIDAETLQIDPNDAARRATRKTRAIVPVHLYGQPCAIAAIRRIGLPVIQDACQAHGATIRGKSLAAFSTHVAYSFYPTKNLGALGDGGAILTNSRRVAGRLRMLRDGGRRGDQVAHVFGINARLDDLQCAFLRAFLPHLKNWNAHRARIAAIYDEELRDCPGVRLLKRTAESVNHLYVIRADRRDRLRDHLGRHGIGTAIHYPVALHRHPAFAQRIELRNAESAVREIVSLPMGPYLKESDARKVAARIRAFY